MARNLEQERVQTRLVVGLALLAAFMLSSCTLALSRRHDQCTTSLDCQAVQTGSVCTDDGVCKSVTPPANTATTHSQPCQHDADCEDAWALCREGACKTLITDDCVGLGVADATDDRERLPIAVLAPGPDILTLPLGPAPAAALLAVDEINAAGPAAAMLPRVITVACDETNGTALAHLIAAGVRVVIGPTHSTAISPVSESALNRAVIFAPFADAPSFEIAQAATRASSIVSCKPNRRESEQPLLSAIDFMRSYLARTQPSSAAGGAVLALAQLESQLGFGDLFRPSELTPHGTQSVTFDPNVETLGRALAAVHVTPNLIVAASTESDWSQNVTTADRYLSNNLPYYLLSDKQADVLDSILEDSRPVSPQDQRAFGLDNHLEPANLVARTQFVSAFVAATGGQPPNGTEYAYDCAYLGIYVAYAALLRYSLSPGQLSPGALLTALNAFSLHAPSLSVGTTDLTAVLSTLQRTRGSDAQVGLIGSSGNLDVQSSPASLTDASDTSTVYVQPNPRAKELYCVDRKNSQFCDTGLIFPVSGGQPRATEGKCSCVPQ